MQTPRRTYLSAMIGAVLASGAVHAGGFSLYTEGSGAAIGNFAAGIAASVQDASTGWYNPAGLPFLNEEQVVFSGVGVFPSNKLSGNSTFTSVIGATPFSYRQNFTDIQSGIDAFVPAFHYSLPVNDRVTVGLSLVSPFGLSTEYSVSSPVRYAATFTELLTTTLSPEFGAKITDNFSVGAGLDWQWAQVKFNRMLGSPVSEQLQGRSPYNLDSLSYNKGHSTGVGFHVGALMAFNDNHTRVGINYQSKMSHTFRGWSELRGPLAARPNTNNNAVLRSDGLYSDTVYFPDIVTLSGYHDINDRWALLGSVIYTNWSVFRTTTLNNVAAATPVGGQFFQVVTNSTAVQNYKDAWRFALGANYQVNDKLRATAGVGYDETPTNNVDRDIRLPDADRVALSIGGHYQYSPAIGVDLGYTYLFAKDNVNVNKTEAIGRTSSYNVTATAKPHAHLVGAQLTWTIDGQEKLTTK